MGDRLTIVMKGEGVAPLVCLSFNRTDISKIRSKKLHRRFRKALGRICDFRGVNLVCGILPRKNVSREAFLSDSNEYLVDHWLIIARAMGGHSSITGRIFTGKILCMLGTPFIYPAGTWLLCQIVYNVESGSTGSVLVKGKCKDSKDIRSKGAQTRYRTRSWYPGHKLP